MRGFHSKLSRFNPPGRMGWSEVSPPISRLPFLAFRPRLPIREASPQRGEVPWERPRERGARPVQWQDVEVVPAKPQSARWHRPVAKMRGRPVVSSCAIRQVDNAPGRERRTKRTPLTPPERNPRRHKRTPPAEGTRLFFRRVVKECAVVWRRIRAAHVRRIVRSMIRAVKMPALGALATMDAETGPVSRGRRANPVPRIVADVGAVVGTGPAPRTKAAKHALWTAAVRCAETAFAGRRKVVRPARKTVGLAPLRKLRARLRKPNGRVLFL